MLKRIFFLFIFLSLLPPLSFAAKDHDWTGFLFKGGIETNPEKGGPFRTPQDCFAWGKSKVWRASDKYACGVDCRKDERGRNICRSIETEASAPAAMAILAKEDAEAEKKAAEISGEAVSVSTPQVSAKNKKKKETPPAKGRRASLRSDRVFVS